MSEYFLVITENEDAYCDIAVNEMDDGFIHFNYNLNMVDVDEVVNWEKFSTLLKECNANNRLLSDVIRLMKGHNWTIQIEKNDGNNNGIQFCCYGNDGPTINLGYLAECYDDCDNCYRCHNLDAQMSINDDDIGDTQYDWCRYYCDGCHEHPCTNINGRKAIEDALNEWFDSSERCEVCKEKTCERTDFCKYD